jgi:carboxysome shell carbonic anhydrase
VNTMTSTQRQQARQKRWSLPTAPMRRPGAVSAASAQTSSQGRTLVAGSAQPADSGHPLCNGQDNDRLYQYESSVKKAFDSIVPTLKQISALQHEPDFEQQAQRIAQQQLGFELPQSILGDAWVEQLDMRRLFAWCVFSTYQRFCESFFSNDPLGDAHEQDFQGFLQSCGFHILDITPCADGRLAHVIRYVLRLPQRVVRRKSFAGAMFDIDDSIQKWVETEMLRYREGNPNLADESTRYLKMVAYHYSSVDPAHEGCAAHGSDTEKAASAGLQQLTGFRQAIENSFCCGASIDLLLVGIDTDTDSMRVHVPDVEGHIRLDRYVDTLDVYKVTRFGSASEGREFIANQVRACAPDVVDGMLKFCARLIENNLSQIDYVRRYFGEAYPDTGHAERFIGAGVGFEEIQLRNLMYFAYLDTVEEATQDLDVGIKIFSGLNAAHGLPVPVVVRFDYHGQVPGARERAVAHCQRVANALSARYQDLAQRGLLHILQVIRDCRGDAGLETLACTVNAATGAEMH